MTETPAPDSNAPLLATETQTTQSTTATSEVPANLLGESAPAPASEAPAPFVPLTDNDILELFGDYAPKGDALTTVSKTFAELQLGKDQAGKLSALYTSMQKEAEQATVAAWNDTIKSWQDQSRAHPDFGGAKFDTSLAQAKQIVMDYGDKAFQEMLAVTGTGNHPAMIAFILKLGAALPGEGKPASTQQTAAPRDLASILFPNHGVQ